MSGLRAKLRCRLFGHRWASDYETFEQGVAWARIGRAHRLTMVPVSWLREAVCADCGAEEWSPW